MDTKRLLTTIIFVAVAFFAAKYLFPTFFGGEKAAPPKPYALYTAIPPTPGGSEQGVQPETRTLGSAEKASSDKLAITVNNVTAGLDLVQLNVKDYAEEVARIHPLTLLKAPPGLAKPFATLTVSVFGAGPEPYYGEYFANQYIWKFTAPYKTGDTSCSLIATMKTKTGDPLIEITKTFQINPASYEISVSHAVKNLTDKELKVEIDQLGPTDLAVDDPRSDPRYYHAASYITAGKTVKGDQFHTLHAKLQKLEKGTMEIGKFVGTDPLLWTAAADRFFTVIVRPAPSANPGFLDVTNYGKIPVVDHVASADIDIMQFDAAAPPKTVSVMRLTGNVVSVAAHQETNMPLAVFMGPKKRDLLGGSGVAPVGSEAWNFNIYQYIKIIQFGQGGPCGFCTFDFLALAILRLFDFLVAYITFGNYGIAIMLLVVVVRASLHPLTRASQINMAKMSRSMAAIKPQIDAIKKRYAKDSAKQQSETMRIYKENNVNPAGGIMGCLPMLIQMPIWLALYAGLQVDIDLRHAAFIPGWINDLSAPDAILSWQPITIPGLSLLLGPVSSLNLLPIFLAGVFFVQMKVQMASQPKAADEQQAQMQKMSGYMILLFPLFLYSAPSGLNVYIFASTMGGLIDTWIVRRALRARGILPANASALGTKRDDEGIAE